jgi:hypothetical protein
MLVGPIGTGGRTWRRWAALTGRSIVVATCQLFPLAEWIGSLAEAVDLPTAAIRCLAQRAGHELNELLAAWRRMTPADRECFWKTFPPDADDDLLRAMATLAVNQNSRDAVAASLAALGERIVPLLLRLVPSVRCPSVLFIAGSRDAFLAVGPMAVQWATLVPALPIAVAVPAQVWHEFLAAPPESRTKALLREGELAVCGIDPATIERMLTEAGVAGAAATVLANIEADAELVESAVGVIHATGTPPTIPIDDDRARSAAERFLFTFLESLPETAGRFELNASLEFPFGARLAEVDLLCRSLRIAIELDGYFHFLSADSYRRDRMKDYELQRRGYLVLRFLAEDVIPQLEVIRDRILDALTITPLGGHPWPPLSSPNQPPPFGISC